MNLKAIIFDKDGTLFDIQRSWSDWCNIFIKKFCDQYKLQTEKLAQALNFDLKLNEFKKETGFGVIVNTSFNVRGEPIVCTPNDALKAFIDCELDFLQIGSFLVEAEHDK